MSTLRNAVVSTVKRAVLTAGGTLNAVPFGVNLNFDIRHRLPQEKLSLILDVGANTGQALKEFRSSFPDAKIMSFEPDPATFSKLKSNVVGNTELYNIGFGHIAGKLRFDNRSPISEIHCIAKDQQDETLPFAEITTVDKFCSDQTIEYVDVLKIDTEGNDLNVIKGSQAMLAKSAIGLLIVECSFIPDPARLVPFNILKLELEQYGYRLFGLYQQAAGHNTGTAQVVWGNCAFVSPLVIKRNR